jgi:hypothetical protein
VSPKCAQDSEITQTSGVNVVITNFGEFFGTLRQKNLAMYFLKRMPLLILSINCRNMCKLKSPNVTWYVTLTPAKQENKTANIQSGLIRRPWVRIAS